MKDPALLEAQSATANYTLHGATSGNGFIALGVVLLLLGMGFGLTALTSKKDADKARRALYAIPCLCFAGVLFLIKAVHPA